MSPRVKRLPRLWCAMQGLLPLDACSASAREALAGRGRAEESAPVSAKANAAGSGGRAGSKPFLSPVIFNFPLSLDRSPPPEKPDERER